MTDNPITEATERLEALFKEVAEEFPFPWRPYNGYADNGGRVSAIVSDDYTEVVGERGLPSDARALIVALVNETPALLSALKSLTTELADERAATLALRTELAEWQQRYAEAVEGR